MLSSFCSIFFFRSLSSSCAALQERGGLSSGMSPSRHTSSSSCSSVSFRYRQCSLFLFLFSSTGRERVSEEKATLWTPPAVPSPLLPPALHNNRRGGGSSIFLLFSLPVCVYVCVRAYVCARARTLAALTYSGIWPANQRQSEQERPGYSNRFTSDIGGVRWGWAGPI